MSDIAGPSSQIQRRSLSLQKLKNYPVWSFMIEQEELELAAIRRGERLYLHNLFLADHGLEAAGERYVRRQLMFEGLADSDSPGLSYALPTDGTALDYVFQQAKNVYISALDKDARTAWCQLLRKVQLPRTCTVNTYHVCRRGDIINTPVVDTFRIHFMNPCACDFSELIGRRCRRLVVSMLLNHRDELVGFKPETANLFKTGLWARTLLREEFEEIVFENFEPTQFFYLCGYYGATMLSGTRALRGRQKFTLIE